MSQVCPNCGAVVGAGVMHCSSCGGELDQFLTILPPKFQSAPAAAPSKPRREPPPEPDASAPGHLDEPAMPAPAPRPKKVRRPVPAPTPAPSPPPPARPAAPLPAHPAYATPPPAYTPPPPTPTYAPPASYAPPPGYSPAPAPPPAQAPVGFFRKKLIEMLGGKADAPAFPQPPAGYAPTQHVPTVSYEPPPPPPAPAPAAVPPPAAPFGGYVPTPGTDTDMAAAADEEGLTRVMGGADLAKLKVPTHPFSLQILDRSGQWQPWSTIGPNGLKIGRSAEGNTRFPELNTMATRHLKLAYDGPRLLAEDQGSLNGVFFKLTQPVELHDGSRFRIGGYVIELRLAEAAPPAEALKSEDGEEFWSRDLRPLASLDFIRPDGSPGPRFPITNPDRTVLGRESRPGKPVDVALPHDEWVSGQHAQLRLDGGRFLLEDLRSRNGTFLRIDGPTAVASGDILLVGRVLLRVVSTLPNQ